MAQIHETGRWGEEIASDFLESLGYRILSRNFHCRMGEIDLIAECADGGVPDQIVMVEVKCRTRRGSISAVAAVTPQKQRKLIATARYWLSKQSRERYIRFDVVEVYGRPGGTPDVYHIVGAFAP